MLTVGFLLLFAFVFVFNPSEPSYPEDDPLPIQAR
jgi:hypothetical protein